MQRLDIETWKNIFRNLKEDNEEVEVIWLDNGRGSEDNNEWVLCFDCELFEDGFQSEEEATERLEYKLYFHCTNKIKKQMEE
jgi:hypothetical protein